jgi:murein DD-endopeptidase MepM/ murein hydrolase activator NlpD
MTRGRVVLLLVLAVAFLFGAVASLHVARYPQVTITPERPGIGRRTPITVAVAESGGRGLDHVMVELVQGDKVSKVAEKSYTPRHAWAFWGPRTLRDELKVEVGRETVTGLRPGDATVRVTATRAGTWLRSPAPNVQERTLPVRLAPPSLYVVSTQHYLAQGGSEVVVYRVGESSVKDGVMSGGWFFHGYPMPGGGPQDRFAFFGAPYDMGDSSKVRLVAEDEIGNRAEMPFIDQYFPRPMKNATLEVSDAFLQKAVPEILSHTTQIEERGSPLESYLAINGELRRKNNARLKELAETSVQRFLWKEPFLLWRNAQVMSSFADRRTYMYKGREVDHQDHLGFDLATTQQSEVPAANSGTVALAEFLGIYGNAVVIDHGYGLMSLYGHLSAIDVKPGQEVTRGQTLGRSGQTGLAGGDHLHFTMLLQGLPVDPREWWDGHWIRDRIARKLGAVFPFEPGEMPAAGSAHHGRATARKRS